MPNIASAEKRLRQNIKRNLANRRLKSSLNTLKRKLVRSIQEKNRDTAMELFKKYASAVDKAARKSVIHSNRAASKKSLFMQKINMIK